MELNNIQTFKVALRWRVEKEVVLGKGQFSCGAKGCNSDQGLKSWEVNFAYIEDKEKKNALVKIRLCPECSAKLNYKSKKREIKRLKKNLKRKKKHNVEKDELESENENSDTNADETPTEEPSTSKIIETGDEGNSLWKKGVQETEEKSREEEFEDYLEELLL